MPTNYETEVEILARGLQRLVTANPGLPEFEAAFDSDAVARVIDRVADRMRDNYPYHHPRYAGQMIKPPHPVARIAYALSLWVNPNNHALDGGRASSAMEKECIADLGGIFGWDAPLGHLTGGGTMANLEALWVSGKLRPGARVLASDMAHYTHSRISDVLGLDFDAVATDRFGRMSVQALRAELEKDDVGTVVVTMGNTGLGAVDPLADIVPLAEEFNVRLHADAAYGGYFGLADSLDPRQAWHFACLRAVDSIVVDPHKHGLQAYGCGSVLFRDSAVGAIYWHDSPYTYFSSAELHLGEISLECSRPGAAAVALWATHQLLPPLADGPFAAGLDDCLHAARDLFGRLETSPYFDVLMPPDLDIVVYAVSASDTSTASRHARVVFDQAAREDLHLALIDLPTSLVGEWLPDMELDSENLTCLRSVLMKPEHRHWTDDIVAVLESAAAQLAARRASQAPSAKQAKPPSKVTER